MKKNVIAAAVAAALIAPVAMAEVTISGGLQAEVVSLSGDRAIEGLYAMDGYEAEGANVTTIGTADDKRENAGNYGFLKFSASEDLGDGMKALAVYNLNANVGDANKAGVDGRDAYVGLSASWGTVLAGTMNTPYKSSTVGWDPMLATSLQARGNGGMSGYQNSYVSNALAYANTFGTVKVVAAVVLDEAADPSTADADSAGKTYGNHATSFSVNAPVGPVELAVAYVNMNDFGADDSTANATKVGVKWVSGDVTVAGQYEMIGAGDFDDTVAYVTGSYAMGNNALSAAYGMTGYDSDRDAEDGTYMMVAMNHKFSKMTNGFVGYRASTNVQGVDGADENALSAGLRVNF